MRQPWFAIGQRLRQYESFIKGRIFASGYMLAANGIDIIDAFWWLPLPQWVFEFCYSRCEYRWAQKGLLHTRSGGFAIHLDFDIRQ